MKIGYIKAIKKQTTQEQSELLIKQGCVKLYVEPSNNVDYKRDKLNELLETLKEEDSIVITRLLVLTSSIQGLLNILKKLEHKRVQLEVLEQGFDTSDALDATILLEVLSEFIEDVRYEKQAIGIYNAKAKGVKLGRKPKMNIKKVQKAIYLKQFNTSQQVANRFGVGTSTLLRHIASYRKAG